MNTFKKYNELKESLFANSKDPEVEGLGYGTPEKAKKTIEIADKLKKTDPGKAMRSVVSMLNRAKYSNGQTEEMREAMKIFQKWIDDNKKDESLEEKEGTTLFHPGNDDAIKGTGYKDEKAANDTIKIIDKLKKTDHMHAMAIATTMMNRAKTHKYSTDDMKKAADIFAKWIKDNRKTEESTFYNFDEFLLEKKFQKEVESSHLADLRYDSDTEILEIDFLNGSTYKYKGVPKDIYKKLALEKNILQKIGAGVEKGARKLFGKDQVDEGTFGTRFWELIRRGGYSYEKIK